MMMYIYIQSSEPSQRTNIFLRTTNQYFVCLELRQQTLSKLQTQKIGFMVHTN